MADLDNLTERQREIYLFIEEMVNVRGYPPTVREIGNRFEIRSPNGVMCHLKALQKKGLIDRAANMSRAIRLTDNSGTGSVVATAEPIGIPLIGRIAAGFPIEAIEQSDEELGFTEWAGHEDKFALRVTGESMIEEHIADGDFVIIHRQENARDGQIVAVRDADGEATLKRIFKEKNRVRLEPANKTMKPIFRDKVDIIGVLVGVVRKY